MIRAAAGVWEMRYVSMEDLRSRVENEEVQRRNTGVSPLRFASVEMTEVGERIRGMVGC
jgi:hypothetical protein